MPDHRLTHGERFARAGALGVQRRNVRGGGGGGEFSRFSSTYLPRNTVEVRVEYEVSIRMLPCPSSPARGLPAERHACGTGCR